MIVDDNAIRVTSFEVVFQPRVSQGFRVIGVEAPHKVIALGCECIVLPPQFGSLRNIVNFWHAIEHRLIREFLEGAQHPDNPRPAASPL